MSDPSFKPTHKIVASHKTFATGPVETPIVLEERGEKSSVWRDKDGNRFRQSTIGVWAIEPDGCTETPVKDMWTEIRPL